MFRAATIPLAAVRASAAPAARPAPGWDLLMLCLGAYLLTSIGRVHQLFPVLQVFRPALLTGAAAILLYLFDGWEQRHSRYTFGRTTTCLVGLLVWSVLCVPGALSEGNSFDLVFDNLIKTVLMYFVLVGATREIRDVERLTLVYLAATTLYAAVIVFRFDLGTGLDWRLGSLYYYDANDFATVVVTALPIGLYFLHTATRSSARLLAGLALGVLIVAFVRSGSRGGFIALMAVGAFIILRYDSIPFRWRFAAVVSAVLLLMGAASDQYWKQMGSILSDTDYNMTSETGRIQIWQRGVDYMSQNPVFGVGPNNFAAAEGTLSPLAGRQQLGIGVRWNAAHNTYIQVGAELGFPGLILFLGMILGAFTALDRSSGARGPHVAHDGPGIHLARALKASLIGFVVGAFFLSLAYSEVLYTLIAFSVGLHKVTMARTQNADE